ncbi:MAG TPA: alpha/beta hydrolase-fold protein [Bryobacteraceae bacterium]
MKRLLIPAILAAAALAQQRPPVLESPDVQNDGRVIFRYFDPDAHNVAVNLEGEAEPVPMQKDDHGVWTATTKPLAPELYGYSFEVDGMHRLDPLNSRIKPNLLNLSNVVHVSGSSPMRWEQQDIPHGTVHHHFYKSNVAGDHRDYYVYTPPGYDSNAAARYPVLYLLHGYSDDASGWTAVGKANLILDSLIDEGRAKPMIVVMPLGYGAPQIVQRPRGTGSAFSNASLRTENFNKFQQALLSEVLPQVERTYRVDSDRNARAIAGLSMGGAEALLTGLNHLDKFSWVGAFSAGGLGDGFAHDFPRLAQEANDQLRVLWIACGTEDRLITPNRSLVTWLKEKGIRLTQIETPGRHTWMVWRRNLIEFAPLLFKSANGETQTNTAGK